MRFFKLHRHRAFTLSELMMAISIGTTTAGAAIFLYTLVYRGFLETSSKVQMQRKADVMVEKITRGPMGIFGGIHSVYYNANGTPGSPNPLISTVTTSPTNQTFSFYVQTNFNNFTFICLTNYQNVAVAARYVIGYDSVNKIVYYTVNGEAQNSMIQDFPANVSMGRFMFIETSNAMVRLQFDLLLLKPSTGAVLTNTYETVAFYRNNPQE